MKENISFFRVNKIEGNQFLSFDMDIKEGYDQVACSALKLECPPFVMPAIFEKSASTLTVRYAVPDGYTSLEEFSGSLMIEDILRLYHSVLGYLKECEDWYLRAESFCFGTQYVFISESCEQLALAYIPDETAPMDIQGLKAVLISILEKCDETSGGTIQLQLYKYFYKPKFSLDEFSMMVENFSESLKKKNEETESTKANKVAISEVELVQQDISEKPIQAKSIKAVKKEVKETIHRTDEHDEKSDELQKEETVVQQPKKQEENRSLEREAKEEVNPRSIYTPQPNRSQLSQEEIEEMVKSIYSSKPLDSSQTNGDMAKSKGSGTGYNEKVEEEVEESFYGSKSKTNEKVTVGLKRKNLFDNVFSSPSSNRGPQKPSASEVRKGPVLKSISTHTRYDLPKVISIDFVQDLFVIGRATRTGEPTGANYEFGAEITPISRIHAQIEHQDDVFYLKDLGSSNGTFLNGTKIEANKPYQIEEGDKIAFAIAFSKNSIEYMFVE